MKKEINKSIKTTLILAWIFGIFIIFAIPQITLYAKIIGIQLFTTAFILVSRYYNFKLCCTMFYVVLVALALSLPLIYIIIFLREMALIIDFALFFSTIGVSIAVLFIPGATVLALMELFWNRIDFRISFHEAVVVSYILSLFIASIVALLFKEKLQLFLFYSVITLLSILLLIYSIYRRKVQIKIFSIFSRDEIFDIILLCLSAIMIITVLYPEATFIPGHDISRHYGLAIAFSINPLHTRGPYPAFWSHIAIIYKLSGNPNPSVLNTVLEFWSIILLIVFYMFVQRFYSELHASIATYLYLFGAGLGWIYILKLAEGDKSWVRTLWHVWQVTNGDIGYGLGSWIWFWYRPVTIGTISLFLLLYVILDEHVDRRIKWLVFFFVPTILMVYHPSEITLAILLLLSASLVKGTDLNHIMLFSIGIASGAIMKCIYVPYTLRQTLIFSSLMIAIALMIHLVSTYIRKLDLLMKNINVTIFTNRITKILYTIIIVSYILAAYYYALEPERYIVTLNLLPVHFYHYVVLLGVPGILALIALLHKSFMGKYSSSDKALVGIMISAFFFGRVITYINESPIISVLISLIGYTYFERRVVASLVYPISCIFASHFFALIQRSLIKKESL